jgi:hypothetical protein
MGIVVVTASTTRGRDASDQDDLRLEAHQLGRRFCELVVALGESLFDEEVLALDVAEVAHPLPESRQLFVPVVGPAGAREVCDPVDLGGLRWRRDRQPTPRQQAEPRHPRALHELAPVHAARLIVHGPPPIRRQYCAPLARCQRCSPTLMIKGL